MNWQLNIYSIALIITTLVSGATAVRIWQKRQSPGTRFLAGFMAAAAVWSLGYALEIGSPDIAAKIFWAKVEYAAIVFTPVLLFLFVAEFTGKTTWTHTRNMLLLWGEPLITLLLFWSNARHGLIWKTWALQVEPQAIFLSVEYGWFFWVHTAYAYGLLLTSLILLVQAHQNTPKDYRGQLRILIFSTLIPWFSNGIYLFIEPATPLDLTPFAFVLVGVLITWGLAREQLFHLPPISREWFIASHQSLSTEEDIRIARYLATILIVIIPLIAIPELIRAIARPAILIYFGPVFITLISAYVLSRTPYYKVGVWLTLSVLALVPIAGILFDTHFTPEKTIYSLIWILPTLILGSLLLQPLNLVLLFGGITIGIVLLPQLEPAITFANLITPISLNMTTTVLLISISITHRNDVRERENQSREIEKQNKFLNDVVNSLSNPFYVINVADYSIALANEAATNYSSETLTTCYALTHRRDTPCNEEDTPCPLAQVLKTKSDFSVEHVHYHKDGRPYYVEVHGSPIFDDDGNIIQIIEYALDITERTLANREIRKLSQAIEQSASTIVITNQHGEIEYANPAFTKITGYSIEEALGQNPNLLKSGQMSSAFYKEMWETILAGKVWTGEFINKKKNGELYWESASISPIRNRNGQTTHYVAVKDNITARKKLEAELIETRDRALEANQLKSQILANVSHDMRTPLGGIIGYSGMIKSGVFGPVTETQKLKLDQILNSSSQLNDFIDNLLGQSEIASGKLILKKEKVTLANLLQEIKDATSFGIQQKQLQLTTHLAADMPAQVIGDRYWLRRILLNLTGNAIKFTDNGGITITIARSRPGHWRLRVEDTGIGISENAQKTIFDPFIKGDPATAQAIHQTGSGLGLAIVKGIVDEMNGTIELDSAIQKGSAFTIVLPLQTPEVN